MSLGNFKLRQSDTTAHLPEWLKPNTLTTSSAGKDVQQQELSSIADGNAKWCSHFGTQFAGFLQN